MSQHKKPKICQGRFVNHKWGDYGSFNGERAEAGTACVRCGELHPRKYEPKRAAYGKQHSWVTLPCDLIQVCRQCFQVRYMAIHTSDLSREPTRGISGSTAKTARATPICSGHDWTDDDLSEPMCKVCGIYRHELEKVRKEAK